MVVKFSTFAGGVYIEVTDKMEYGGNDRCFRFDRNGNAEWARYSDLEAGVNFARWYGFNTPADQFIVC